MRSPGLAEAPLVKVLGRRCQRPQKQGAGRRGRLGPEPGMRVGEEKRRKGQKGKEGGA